MVWKYELLRILSLKYLWPLDSTVFQTIQTILTVNFFLQTTPVPTRSRLLRPQVVFCVPNTSRSWFPDQSVVTVVFLCKVSLLWDQENTLLSPRPTRPSPEPTVVPDVPTVSRKELSELSWLKNKRSSRRLSRNKPKLLRRLKRRRVRRTKHVLFTW